MVLKGFLQIIVAAFLLSACTAEPTVIGSDAPPDAQRLYAIHCAACHKADGLGGISGAKNLRETVLDEEQIRLVIANGQGDMMPFESLLKPTEISALAGFVHDFKNQ